jgi:hypothetical protein
MAAVLPTLSPAMIARIAALFLLIAVVVLRLDFSLGADAPETPSKPPVALRQYAMLRNGETLSGEILKDGNFFVIVNGGSEARLPERDVELVCQSLDEAYLLRQSRAKPGQIEDRLNLADWCLRNDLLGYAAREIAAAMQIDPKNRKAKLLDSRLQLAMKDSTNSAAPGKVASTRTLPATPEELDRLVKCLPSGSVESYTSFIQPMLLNSCATAGCHGPGSASKFTLIRTASGQTPPVRVTQRNLHSTIQWIDNNKPADSKLLIAAREPHGNNATPAASLDAAKGQELLVWVTHVSQRSNTPAPMETAATERRVKQNIQANTAATPYNPPGSLGSAVQAVVPMNPRSLFSPQPHRVQASRPTAASIPSFDPLPAFSTAPDKSANLPAGFNQLPSAPVQTGQPAQQQRPLPVSRPAAHSDEIPNANEVLPTRN